MNLNEALSDVLRAVHKELESSRQSPLLDALCLREAPSVKFVHALLRMVEDMSEGGGGRTYMMGNQPCEEVRGLELDSLLSDLAAAARRLADITPFGRHGQAPQNDALAKAAPALGAERDPAEAGRRLQDDKASLESDVAALGAMKAGLQEEYGKRSLEFREKSLKLQAEADELAAELKELRGKVAAGREELSDTQYRLRAGREELSQIMDALGKAKGELEEQSRRVAELKQEREDLAALISAEIDNAPVEGVARLFHQEYATVLKLKEAELQGILSGSMERANLARKSMDDLAMGAEAEIGRLQALLKAASAPPPAAKSLPSAGAGQEVADALAKISKSQDGFSASIRNLYNRLADFEANLAQREFSDLLRALAQLQVALRSYSGWNSQNLHKSVEHFHNRLLMALTRLGITVSSPKAGDVFDPDEHYTDDDIYPGVRYYIRSIRSDGFKYKDAVIQRPNVEVCREEARTNGQRRF
jgi:molecular chaperone GrpE (heat shock protein)